MVLNLLPIPPLDGGRIAVSLLPNRLAYRYAQLEKYSLVIIIVLAILLTNRMLEPVLKPLINGVISILFGVFS